MKMCLENQTADTDMDKAGLFAQFFASVYKNHSHDESRNEIMRFINNRNDRGCFNIMITDHSVFSVLNSMDLSKGSGHDGISSLFLRECSELLSDPLSVIFSKSMQTHVYPKTLKIGQATPIFKAGETSDVTNYRGVNVLPSIAKVFEKGLYNQLKLHVLPQISEKQHGFVPIRSIETNLIEFTVRAHEAFEGKGQYDVFYADISKAFDSVDVNKLILKLANFSISNETLRWFVSYLGDRKQYVRVGKEHSESFDVLSGVGQGTILGPLLFIMFFNDSTLMEYICRWNTPIQFC